MEELQIVISQQIQIHIRKNNKVKELGEFCHVVEEENFSVACTRHFRFTVVGCLFKCDSYLVNINFIRSSL